MPNRDRSMYRLSGYRFSVSEMEKVEIPVRCIVGGKHSTEMIRFYVEISSRGSSKLDGDLPSSSVLVSTHACPFSPAVPELNVFNIVGDSLSWSSPVTSYGVRYGYGTEYRALCAFVSDGRAALLDLLAFNDADEVVAVAAAFDRAAARFLQRLDDIFHVTLKGTVFV